MLKLSLCANAAGVSTVPNPCVDVMNFCICTLQASVIRSAPMRAGTAAEPAVWQPIKNITFNVSSRRD